MGDERKETTVYKDLGRRENHGEKIDGRIVVVQPLPSIVQPTGSSFPVNQPKAETPGSGGGTPNTNSDRAQK